MMMKCPSETTDLGLESGRTADSKPPWPGRWPNEAEPLCLHPSSPGLAPESLITVLGKTRMLKNCFKPYQQLECLLVKMKVFKFFRPAHRTANQPLQREHETMQLPPVHKSIQIGCSLCPAACFGMSSIIPRKVCSPPLFELCILRSCFSCVKLLKIHLGACALSFCRKRSVPLAAAAFAATAWEPH